MTGGRFSQPNVVHALCLALAKLHDAPHLSPRILAAAVASQFPGVPLPALRTISAKVLALHFEPMTPADMESAGLDDADATTACDFFAAVLRAEADELAQDRNRRDGANVVNLTAPA